MKDIGIMTWIKYNNYGSILQATAMSDIVSRKKYNPIFINYNAKGEVRDYYTFEKIKSKVIRKLKREKSYTSATNVFDEYRKKYIKTTNSIDNYVELANIADNMDCIICGSDQIWSPLCFDSHYFLDFASEDKMISYAPSIGSNEIKNENIRNQMSELLKRFKHLSVREEQGRKIVKEISGKEAKVVLDPTLLLNKDEWSKYKNNKIKSKLPNKYILCYFLGKSDCYLRMIEEYAKKNNLDIINVPVFENRKINKYNPNFQIGPSEFLSLVENSECVFTDSFHGTIFSINFNINFYTLKRFKVNDSKNQNSRIYNILDKLDLLDRIIEKESKLENILDIDYLAVNKKLDILKKDSIDYLYNSIENVMNTQQSTNNEYHKGHITNYCTGCSACANICPVNAISIIDNEEGFQHYKIDEKKCIGCGLCEKVCPMCKLDTKPLKENCNLYSFKSNNEQIINTSSSGGFAAEICKFLNEKGYYVCGCYYDEKNNLAKHIIINPERSKDIIKLSGSKYIQSHVEEAINRLINLQDDAKVLFIGTPCQVAGVDKLLKQNNKRDNFILVDLICHGVPTKYLWNKYLKEITKKHNIASNPNVEFRAKSSGWRKMHMKIYDSDKTYVENEDNDLFFQFFKEGSCYNKSCFECAYRQNSSADIRIGDYWGNKFNKDKTGVSMIISNTKLGDDIIKNMETLKIGTIHKQNIEEYWTVQYPENPLVPIYYDELIRNLKNEEVTLKELSKKYYKYENLRMKYRKIKSIIKK